MKLTSAPFVLESSLFRHPKLLHDGDAFHNVINLLVLFVLLKFERPIALVLLLFDSISAWLNSDLILLTVLILIYLCLKLSCKFSICLKFQL